MVSLPARVRPGRERGVLVPRTRRGGERRRQRDRPFAVDVLRLVVNLGVHRQLDGRRRRIRRRGCNGIVGPGRRGDGGRRVRAVEQRLRRQQQLGQFVIEQLGRQQQGGWGRGRVVAANGTM